ncbi:50S ribosomal protein L27 [Morganella morganii]|uniref:50S ribosomal protein L27 n=1 Tax=Morganella morganii TaxID=582 RepID=UPI0015F49A62|nr:50S ribosomal protein L27 [Morganella morganii]MBA5859232.1 50S ribosomal protein L27 [Morganella morganii]
MALKETRGSTRNGSDYEAKRLGIKSVGSKAELAGSIIVHQRGNKCHEDSNEGCSRNHTLFALADGKVKYEVTVPKNHKFISIEDE